MRRVTLPLLPLLLFVTLAHGEIAAYKWHSSREGHQVIGMNIDTGKVAWKFTRRSDINFVERVRDGLLVGSDDGRLCLLDPKTGTARWDTKAMKRDVNQFRGEYEKGYLISDGEDQYFFVGHDGKVLW